jgi:hypothetical protein
LSTVTAVPQVVSFLKPHWLPIPLLAMAYSLLLVGLGRGRRRGLRRLALDLRPVVLLLEQAVPEAGRDLQAVDLRWELLAVREGDAALLTVGADGDAEVVDAVGMADVLRLDVAHVAPPGVGLR